MGHKRGPVVFYPTITFIIVVLSIFQISPSACVDFDQNYTGVAFSPYVKRKENSENIPWWKTYSLEDIKTMVKLVSGKFSTIATFGVGTDNVQYEPNVTYYKNCSSVVYTAEAAALINEEQDAKKVTILIGIWQSDVIQQMRTEMKVALESAEKANNIYPGTALGLILSQSDMGHSIDRAQQTLNNIENYRDDVNRLQLKFGTRQKCNRIDSGDTGNDTLASILREIVKKSDFIICEAMPTPEIMPSGAEAGFNTVKLDLEGFRNELKSINPNIEMFGQTGWSSKGSNTGETIHNLKEYWEIVNIWGAQNQVTMWLLEAFDNPWKDGFGGAHYGWWRVKENSKVGLIDGYAEKIFERPEEENAKAISHWVYAGATVGALAVILALTLITKLYLRVNKLQESLTKAEVREFMYGISDDAVAQQGGDAVVESALKVPYDKSYEISKDCLTINKNALLGTGQFGCVFKALIENEEVMEVALKMTKNDCPKNALKGLLSEIKILTYLGKHPNIVSILGAYTSEMSNGIVYLATELCNLGSLEGYLRDNDSNLVNNRYANAPVLGQTYLNETEFRAEITFLDMVRWSHEIACGMEYLGTKHVVHADLATRNVLLAPDKTAKITDFGLSRRLYDYTNYVKQQQEPLPWRWMAIESLKKLEFSAKSDVWSYGVTLWEIFAMGDLPYPGLSWNLEFVDSLVNGLRMNSPPHATPEVYKVMVDCWHLESNNRPTFTDLKLSTGHIIEKCAKGNQSNS